MAGKRVERLAELAASYLESLKLREATASWCRKDDYTANNVKGGMVTFSWEFSEGRVKIRSIRGYGDIEAALEDMVKTLQALKALHAEAVRTGRLSRARRFASLYRHVKNFLNECDMITAMLEAPELAEYYMGRF